MCVTEFFNSFSIPTEVLLKGLPLYWQKRTSRIPRCSPIVVIFSVQNSHQCDGPMPENFTMVHQQKMSKQHQLFSYILIMCVAFDLVLAIHCWNLFFHRPNFMCNYNFVYNGIIFASCS